MTEPEETAYEHGASPAKWIAEREEIIAVLRSVCAEHGDNDWDETLSLADVIDKHLHRHLAENSEK